MIVYIGYLYKPIQRTLGTWFLPWKQIPPLILLCLLINMSRGPGTRSCAIWLPVFDVQEHLNRTIWREMVPVKNVLLKWHLIIGTPLHDSDAYQTHEHWVILMCVYVRVQTQSTNEHTHTHTRTLLIFMLHVKMQLNYNLKSHVWSMDDNMDTR